MNFLTIQRQHWHPLQLAILDDRMVNRLTYSALRSKYNFKSNESIISFIYRSLLGCILDPHTTTEGRIPLIPEIPSKIFFAHCQEKADSLNCLKTHQAVKLLEQTVAEYNMQSYMIAGALGCPTVANKIMERLSEIEISPQWFNKYLKDHGYSLMNPQTLQIERNKYCHENVLVQFIIMLRTNIHQCPFLLFNADETASSFNRKGKIVVPNGSFPSCEEDTLLGHYTMMCCCNAAGDAFKPFIILPSRQTFPPELNELGHKAYFASSPSGWMTSKLFLAWCVFFVHELQQYRIQITEVLEAQQQQNATTFLFLDGHRSRLNSQAIELLFQNNVSVIVFPSHTTHVIQPFDVGLAAPLKCYIKKLSGTIPQFMVNISQGFNNAQRSRYFMAHTLIDAWQSVTSQRNIQSAWDKTGIYPINENRPRQNVLVRQTQPNDLMAPPARGIQINGMCISTPQKRLEIAKRFYGDPNLNVIPPANKPQIINYLKQGHEKILSKVPQCPVPFTRGIVFYDFY